MKPHLVAFVAVLAAACSSATVPDRSAPVPAAGAAGGSTTASAGDDDDQTPGDDDDDGDAGSGAGSSDGSAPTPVATDGGALDWQDLYTLYFGPDTVGHCAQCHGGGLAGFTTGKTADAMYQGMISAKLLDTATPSESVIGIPGMSPLAWYNVPASGKTTLAGLMPNDAASADPVAAAAVTAWVVSGAPNHGVGPGGQIIAPPDAGSPDAGAGDAGTHDGGSDAGSRDGGSDGGKDSGTDAGPPAGTFGDVYDNWLGPNTPGHCSNTRCHNLSTSRGSVASGFICGDSAADCFEGLVKAGLVSTSDPASSVLGAPETTPLSWYGKGGPMPADEAMTNAAGAAAITAWINAGAKND